MNLRRTFTRQGVAALAAAFLIQPAPVLASSHREAPITALDQKADITDWYAFVSPEKPGYVVFIMNVDPFLEPSNGPNYFPFDPGILYEMKIDNNKDGYSDVTFQFRFKTEIQQPGVFTGYVGNLAGIAPITSLTGPGAAGMNLVQTYSVTMKTATNTEDLGVGQTLNAVPANVGPRTMPNYSSLRQQGIYTLSNNIRVFAGTVADPFFIDLGAAFDSLNFRKAAGGGVLSAAQDADDTHNYAPNAVSGYDCNTIALEVPIAMLTSGNQMFPASDKRAVIGTWATTSRRQVTVLGVGGEGRWAQVQRMGNPLINELLIGTGSKDRFSTDQPKNDAQFAPFLLNPLLGQIFGSLGIPVPPAPRTDLLILAQYMAPICPGCTAADAGPVADLLRLNTGIAAPPIGTTQHRLGFLAGDTNGFPNGRRLNDDVVDIASRAVGGILVDGKKYGTAIGDGVNTPAVSPDAAFPFVAAAYDGRDSIHGQGPGQNGCTGAANGVCPVQ
ncbi:MAG TPA: DUF4331 domain-containing protein [Bryobacteraceae bacterium]|nr:DUF4331 domain-containing protein [Bryobacteraceae bacterium]